MKLRWAVIVGLLAASGCSTTGFGSRQAVSAGPGAGVRTLSAAQIVEAMAGGLIGGSIGKGLGDGERRKALEAEYRALGYSQSGQAVAWKGDSDARSGTVVAAQPYRVGSQDCRQYSQTVSIDGATRSARGTACRNADGSWTTLG